MATAAAVLQSDHVDYLIWRYLQERGYGRAAVELQRAWRSEPQSLPFTASVVPHTLVALVQDGLLFDELSSNIDHEKARRTGARTPLQTRRYTFLQDNQQRKRRASPLPDRRDESRVSPGLQNNASERKKLKVDVNGARRGKPRQPVSALSAGPDVMDMDQRSSSRSDAQLAEDDEMPVKEEIPPPPTTLEVGQSTGIQSEPVVDNTIAKALTTFAPPDADIIHATWDSADASRLVLSGGSIFKSYRIPEQASESDGEPPFDAVINHSGSFYVTARCQHKDRLAYATKMDTADEDCNVQVIVREGDEHRLLSTPGDITLFLRWNQSGTLLLGSSIARNNGRGLLFVWDVESDSDASIVRTKTPALDGLWLDDTSFLVSGDCILDIYKVIDGAVERQSRLHTDRSWDTIRLDAATKTVATLSPEERLVGVLDTPSSQLQLNTVHDDTITAIEWQPVVPQDNSEQRQRALATSSLDGTVRLWSVGGQLELVETFRMDPETPITAMAFSQDGQYLAAAGQGRVQAWEAKAQGERIAHWVDAKTEEEEDEAVAAGGNTAEDVEMEDDESDSPLHTVVWNSTSSAIVFTSGDKVAVIALPTREQDSDLQPVA